MCGLTGALLQRRAQAHVDVVDPDVAFATVLKEPLNHHLAQETAQTHRETEQTGPRRSKVTCRHRESFACIDRDMCF